MNIGAIDIDSPCILAPMAGISNLPFRTIARRFGCQLAFTEMISTHALAYASRKTEKMLLSAPHDHPLGVQLLGNSEESILDALAKLETHRHELIDFNAACPAPKVTRKGMGASLLKEPRTLGRLLRVIVKNSSVPVSVKIRSGWDETGINARETALICRDAGIHALTVHGRTRTQRYKGSVNYAVIREVKEAIDIPVIASGDALSPRLIKKMFDETGCDCVAVARGALGNPWIFRDTEAFIRTGVLPSARSASEVSGIMAEHLEMLTAYHGEKTGAIEFRKFYGWYIKGFSGMKHLRQQAFRAETKAAMELLIQLFTDTARHPEAMSSAE